MNVATPQFPMQLNHDTNVLAPADLAAREHARSLQLQELLPLLASPDTGKSLHFEPDSRSLGDGTHQYPLRGALPLLIPARLQPHFTDRLVVPMAADHDAFMQYFLLATIKQSGEINAAPGDVHFQRHLFRAREFLRGSRGLLLDVGCDDPQIGAGLLPSAVSYVGLDPFCMRTAPFRLVGLGEFLPFRDASLDNVLFNTSLDHIFDWHRALEEAHRVLRANGVLWLITLAWTARAGLISDSVHFHHFRESELLGALQGLFDVQEVLRYDYKGNSHRYGLYLRAAKRAR